MHPSNPPRTFPSHPPDPSSNSNPGSSPHTPLQPPPPTTSTTMSDIFSTTPSPPPSPTTSSTPHATNATDSEPSDIPRLRSTHATAGYRDGIASSKESTIQAGFDEGYALGATVATRAGWVLGVLEGVRDGLVAGKLGVRGGGRGAGELEVGGGGNEEKGEARRVEKLLADARAELSVQGLIGERYWGVDGVWRFEVVGSREGEGEVTFLEVAEQHPLVRKWVGVVLKEAERWGVDLKGFEGEEWERGRVGNEVLVGLQG